jgi:putative membrane protein
MFDRVGHFSVGFYAFALVEYLETRNKMSRRLACLFAVFTIAFVAMSYELIEWGYAATAGGESGANFLGSQGDIWDAQKDMLMDTLGAITVTVLYLVLRGLRGARGAPSRPAHPGRATVAGHPAA